MLNVGVVIINQSKQTVPSFTALQPLSAQDCLLKFNFFIMDFAEEIPLLDLEIPPSLDPADVPKFYEAFKQFDVQDTGFVLISVKITVKHALSIFK